MDAQKEERNWIMLITAVSTQPFWQLSLTMALQRIHCHLNTKSLAKSHKNCTVLSLYSWFIRLKVDVFVKFLLDSIQTIYSAWFIVFIVTGHIYYHFYVHIILWSTHFTNGCYILIKDFNWKVKLLGAECGALKNSIGNSLGR